MDDMVVAEALKHASHLLGGDAALAARLGATTTELDAWISGARELPDDKLLALLDVILSAMGPQQAA